MKLSASSFGVQRSKFKVVLGPTCWIMHFLALLTYYLENYWTAFCPTLSVNAFLDKDECVNFGGQKVKGQRRSMTKGPAGGGIQLDVACQVITSGLVLNGLTMLSYTTSVIFL